MKFKSFLFFLFILNELFEKIINQTSTLSIKFKRYIGTENDDFFLKNYNNDIYISLKVGNPQQNVEKIFLKADTYELMISNSTLVKGNYNYSNSYTSKLISYPKYFQLKYTSKGHIIKDHFYFENINNNKNNNQPQLQQFQNISFLYASHINNNLYTSVIGFQLADEEVKNSKPLICQLKDLKYIKDTKWTIEFISEDEDEDEGIIYIGDILNENVFKGFKMDGYRRTKAIIFGRYLSWDLLFSQIEYDDNKIGGAMQANLDFNFGFISCSKEYYDSIKNTFFNYYINKGICSELLFDKYNKNNYNKINLNTQFNYIVCEKNLNFKKFPEISFYHTELDFDFILTYKELFMIYNDKIYFLCINEIMSNNRWIFGKPFFKKYNLIFDYDSKTIGIYNELLSGKNKKTLIIFEWIIAMILFIIFIILVFTVVRRYRINNYKSFEKRIKVDELNETFYDEFSLKNNMNKLSEIKEENKIIDDN